MYIIYYQQQECLITFLFPRITYLINNFYLEILGFPYMKNECSPVVVNVIIITSKSRDITYYCWL